MSDPLSDILDSAPTLRECQRRGVGLRATCIDCGHTAKLHPDTIARRMSPDTTLDVAAGKLACRECRGKRIKLETIDADA